MDSNMPPAPTLAVVTSGILNGSRCPAPDEDVLDFVLAPFRWGGVLADFAALAFSSGDAGVAWTLGDESSESCWSAQLKESPNPNITAAKSKSRVACDFRVR
jgi:hypothetical protein